MEQLVAFILFTLFTLIYITIVFRMNTYLHELSHFRAAYSFQQVSGVIKIKTRFYNYIKIKKLDNKNDLIIRTTHNLVSSGFTSLSNDYLTYSDEELKVIAAAGKKNQSKRYVYFALPYIIIMSYLMTKYESYCYAFIISYICSCIIMIVRIFILVQKNKRLKSCNEDIWTDDSIINDPCGFKNYMKSLNANNENLYINNL